MVSSVQAAARYRLEEDRPVQSHIQNAVAVLAVALAIAMLGLTLVVPHRSLAVSDQTFYADAG
jgi:hypothetical protein